MSAALFVYLASVAGNLNVALALSLAFLLALLACAVLPLSVEGLWTEKDHPAVAWFKRGCISAAAIAALLVLVPGEKTLYLIAGVAVTEEIAKSPAAQQIGNKVLDVINGKLDKALENK